MRFNPDYERVKPRDLFNEAKLLKCMGRFWLLVQDELLPYKVNLDHNTINNKGFHIIQDGSDASIFIGNITVEVEGVNIFLYANYNNKSNYPFFAMLEEECYRVFDEDGNFTEDFLKMCEILKTR